MLNFVLMRNAFCRGVHKTALHDVFLRVRVKELFQSQVVAAPAILFWSAFRVDIKFFRC